MNLKPVIIKVYAEIIEMQYFNQASIVVNRKLDLYGLKYECDSKRFETLYYYVIWKIELKGFAVIDVIYRLLKKTLYKYYRNWDFIFEVSLTEKEV